MALLPKLYDRAPNWFRSLMLNGYAAKIHWQRFGKVFADSSAELERCERLSPGDLEEYQSGLLRKIIDHAYATVPYYRELFAEHGLSPADIKSTADLKRVPLLPRAKVRENKERLISTAFSKRELYPGHTSGTTGSPLQFFWDLNTCIYTNAVDWRQKRWAGVNYGEPIAIFLGRMIVPPRAKQPPFWQHNYLHNHLWMSSFHLSDDNFPHYLEKLNRFKPVAIEGYPSTTSIVARLLLKRGLRFPVRAVFTSSETLLPSQREVIEEAFQCKVFDFLGMAERVVFATECEHHNGFHLNAEFAVNEIVDRDGNPVPAGQPGYIVGTSLRNFGMPFIRYLTTDVSAIVAEPCPCGRSLPRLAPVTTKDEDLIVTPEGRVIASSILTHPFKPLRSIHESQLLQETVDELTVRIVKNPEFVESDGEKLIAGLRERLGEGIRIRLEFVDSIARTPAGKFRWVISKVKPPL